MLNMSECWNRILDWASTTITAIYSNWGNYWVAKFLMEAPWVAIVLAFFLSSDVRKALAALLQNSWRFTKVDLPGGIQLTLDKENVSQYAKKYKELAEKQIREEYRKVAQKNKIAVLHRQLVDHHLVKLFDPKKLRSDQTSEYRSTIHVLSALDEKEESLYQLLEYYPSKVGYGETIGRCQSIRFGIIGKAYRTQNAQYDKKVSTRPEDLVKIGA